MGVILVLAASILFPVLLYMIIRLIEYKSRLRMYWIIMPLSLIISMLIPFLYIYIKGPSVLFSLEAVIDQSLKSGMMSFLVIPSFTAALVCTLYGYLRISRGSVAIMAAVCIAGAAGCLSGGNAIERLLNEPSIRWGQLGADEVAEVGMWIYIDTRNAGNRYIGLNEQETDQIRIMLNSIPDSVVHEIQYAERTLAAEIWLSFKKNDQRSVRIQYDKHEIYAEITDKRSQKYFYVQAPRLKDFFNHKLQE